MACSRRAQLRELSICFNHRQSVRWRAADAQPLGGWFTKIVDKDMQNMQLPDQHQDVVNRFIAACQADERIIAAFLGGSYAEGKADKYSDLDLFFITTDQAYETFLTERERFIRVLGEPLFLEDFGKTHGYFVIFSNGADCEIWFGRESHFHDIHGGSYKVLLDKKGVLAGAVFPIHVADEVEQIEVLRRQLDWFWHELSHFIKAMARQQLWFAYGQLEVLRQICVNLARLQYNFSDAYGGEEPYFKIEQVMPIEQLSPLQPAYCAMEYGPMLQAANIICSFYRDIAPSLAKVHNLTYQNGLETMLVSQLEDLNDVRRN
jgi:predicted nucleotidyltransferase